MTVGGASSIMLRIPSKQGETDMQAARQGRTTGKFSAMKRANVRGMLAVWLIIVVVALAGCGTANEQETAGTAVQNEASTNTESPANLEQDAASEIATEQSDRQAASWTVAHELGELTLDKVPQKIVVLDTYLLDIALALGLQPTGVATESADQAELPSYLQSVVDFAFTWVGARNEPSLEAIADLEPDLIVADLFRHTDGYEALNKIAPTLVVTGSGAEDWQHIIRKLGEATDRREQAEAVIAEFAEKLEAGKSILAAQDQIAVAPMTLYPQSKVRIYAAESFTGAILQGLGLALPFHAGGEPFAEVSVEALSEVEADAFILLQSPRYTQDVVPESYPIFKDLAVVQAGHSHTVSMEQWAFYRGPIAGKIIIDEALELFTQQ